MGNQPSSGSGGSGGVGGVNRRRSSTANNNNNSGGGPTTTTTGSVPTFRLPQLPQLPGTTGSLKLSRSELDKRCQPSGLYPTTPWDSRTIRRLIGDGKLAARLRGTDIRSRPTDQECPICFLHYAQVNITKCCNAAVCTECYLQVRPQKDKNTAPCPFCNCSKVTVRVAKMMTDSQIRKREAEEQRIIEAQIDARKSGMTGESSGGVGVGSGGGGGNNHTSRLMTEDGTEETAPLTPTPYREESRMQSLSGGTAPTTPNTPPQPQPRPGEFGSALNRHRSESFASSDGGGSASANRGRAPSSDGSLTLTPTQRSQIHAQLQSQNSHPLARQMAEEARQRRERNELEYYRSHSGRLLERYEEYQRRARQGRAMADRMLLRSHGIPTRGEPGFGLGSAGGGAGGGSGSGTAGGLAPRNDDGDDATPGGGGGDGGVARIPAGALAAAMGASSGGDLDDLMVIEAALMLSMEEEAERRRTAADGDGEEEGGGGRLPMVMAKKREEEDGCRW